MHACNPKDKYWLDFIERQIANRSAFAAALDQMIELWDAPFSMIMRWCITSVQYSIYIYLWIMKKGIASHSLGLSGKDICPEYSPYIFILVTIACTVTSAKGFYSVRFSGRREAIKVGPTILDVLFARRYIFLWEYDWSVNNIRPRGTLSRF